MDWEILSTTKDLDYFGGAQKVLVEVHEGIKKNYKAKILGFSKFKNLHPDYNIKEEEYVQFGNPFYLNNKLIIVHDRRIITFIMAVKRLFFLNTKVLYIAHCVYSTLNWASLFPKDIISISTSVTDNLINYFHLKNRNIRLIYNGIEDKGHGNSVEGYKAKGKLTILFLARFCANKRQLEVVDHLIGKLSPDIELRFAGTGPDYQQLVDKCKGSLNIKTFGFIEQKDEMIEAADYLMLFSIREGLPIALIEGVMHGKPLLVNDVGGNTEIGVPGVNGILLDEDLSQLAETLNKLVDISDHEYERMSTNSRQRYESMFQYDKMIIQYLEVINEL